MVHLALLLRKHIIIRCCVVCAGTWMVYDGRGAVFYGVAVNFSHYQARVNVD